MKAVKYMLVIYQKRTCTSRHNILTFYVISVDDAICISQHKLFNLRNRSHAIKKECNSGLFTLLYAVETMPLHSFEHLCNLTFPFDNIFGKEKTVKINARGIMIAGVPETRKETCS